jgi:NAD+ synthetase
MTLKIHLAQINTSVGDLDGNVEKILHQFQLANESGCDLAVFPEMTICGYPCDDLWQKKYFILEVQKKITEICEKTRSARCAILLGAPTIDSENKKEVFRNSALFIENGEVKKIINKRTLPNYSVFDEVRYFKAAQALSTIEFRGQTLAILVCEDLWDLKNHYLLGEQIFDAAIAINASPYTTQKHNLRQEISEKFTTVLHKPLIYVNQVGAQDSLVFDGSSFVMNSNGKIILQMKEFVEDHANFELKKNGEVSLLVPNIYHLSSSNERNYAACVLGLRDYIQKNNFEKVILGMSGGIDSALVAAIAVDALGKENVALFALPSRFNSQDSMNDAKECARNLGVNLEVISIEMMFEAALFSLKNLTNLAKENLQSRIRGNMLMALSNSTNALLLSTGNKSELACGYATIYGDMCGAFNPIKDVYKTQVYELAKLKSDVIPKNIFTKAPTAELRENQKDSDSLPEYEILDAILFALIEEQKSISEIAQKFDEALVKKVAKLFYSSEYKRKQSVIGPKISDMSFDRDRRYPTTNKFNF